MFQKYYGNGCYGIYACNMLPLNNEIHLIFATIWMKGLIWLKKV